jgi:phosphoenolpyruvate carboxykinase (ATP)
MTALQAGLHLPEVKTNCLEKASVVYHHLSVAALIEHALRNQEGILTSEGAFVSRTGQHTGRSPKDKYVVDTPDVHNQIDWGAVNQPMSPQTFEQLHHRILSHLQNRPLYVQDLFVGADPHYRVALRVITEQAWHSLFAHQLFIRPSAEEPANFKPSFLVINAPDFQAAPQTDGTRSKTVIAVNFEERIVLIGGTAYAGEIKKSMFTIMNYLMPQVGVFPMHCAANKGKEGDVALFFGLSGTGKTSLSADPERQLIGDDEHGWSEEGIFNFEGGCYAKCIRLSKKNEPQIWNAIRFGSVVENVVVDPETRIPDYDDDSITENTRAAYPLHFIENAILPSTGGHPKNIFFLTCDAFGVLPPISRLTTEQAMEQFLLGYTAKVAGTERGITEPQMTFSTCFGAPFLPLRPREYARLLGEKLERHKAQVWLLNTGWTGGGYGVGERIPIQYTRAMIQAALSGTLHEAEYRQDPVFELQAPTHCPGVPAEPLDPRSTWSDPAAYDAQARMLAEKMREHTP